MDNDISRRNTETHEAILRAAAAILREEGYSKLTIEGIAKRSGAGKPTIYRWWPNKTALLIEVFDRETTPLLSIDDQNSVYEEVLQWFGLLWQEWRSTVSGEIYRSILAEIQSDSRALEYFNASYIPHRRSVLREILRRAQSRGELAGRDAEAIVDYCCGFNWYYLLTHQVPSETAIRDVARTVCALEN